MAAFTATPIGKLNHTVAVAFLETRRAELTEAAEAVDALATEALLDGDMDAVNELLDLHSGYMCQVARIDACRR